MRGSEVSINVVKCGEVLQCSDVLSVPFFLIIVCMFCILIVCMFCSVYSVFIVQLTNIYHIISYILTIILQTEPSQDIPRMKTLLCNSV